MLIFSEKEIETFLSQNNLTFFDLGIQDESFDETSISSKNKKEEKTELKKDINCFICNKSLSNITDPRIQVCSKNCSKERARILSREAAKVRHQYKCVICLKEFDVSTSMWHQVRLRGSTCASCNSNQAKISLGQEGPEDLSRERPCKNCVHSYLEKSSFTGYGCKANARICAPNVYARLFQKCTEIEND